MLEKSFIVLTFIGTLGLVAASCSSTREFWRYVVEDKVDAPLTDRGQGQKDAPRQLYPHNVKVVYSDGSSSTEVLIPILTSGQQIVIDHKSRTAPSAISLAPLPPTDADKAVDDAYAKSGQPVSNKAPAVSIINTHAKIRELVQQGNYALALEYAEQLLSRYPNHVQTLRTKGSLLLKMGEREAALKAYYKAQEIQHDSRVDEQIKAIEKALNQ